MGIARTPLAIKRVETPLPNQGLGQSFTWQEEPFGVHHRQYDSRQSLASCFQNSGHFVLGHCKVLCACLPSDQIKRPTYYLWMNDEAETAEELS